MARTTKKATKKTTVKRSYVRTKPTLAVQLKDAQKLLAELQGINSANNNVISQLRAEREENLKLGLTADNFGVTSNAQAPKVIHEITDGGRHRIMTVGDNGVEYSKWASREEIAVLGDWRATTSYWDSFLPAGVFIAVKQDFMGMASA